MENARDAILARLTAEESPSRDRFVEAWTDNLLDQQLKTLLDPTDLAALLLDGLTHSNVERTLKRHLKPSRDRTRALWAETGETPGDLLADEAKAHLKELIAREEQRSGSMRWARDAVDPALVRELMAPVLQEILLTFARRLPRPSLGNVASGDGAAAKVAGRLGGLRSKLKTRVGKRAEQLASAGKSVLGGLSSEFEQKVQNAAREFSESASSDIRNTVKERLKSSEGKALLAKMRLQVFDAFLATPMVELVGEVDEVSMDDLVKVLGPTADHNRLRDVFRRGIGQEIDAWFALEGERTLRQLFDEAGQLEQARTGLLARTQPLTQNFFASPAFADWIGDLLKEQEGA